MKIGIMGKGFMSWGGGVDFLRFCMNALLSQKEIELVLFLPVQNSLKDSLKDILRPAKHAFLSIIQGRIPRCYANKKDDIEGISKNFKIEYPNMEIVSYTDNRHNLLKALNEYEIDVVFPSIESLGEDFPYPWVGYLYDFQHKYYPEFFSQADILRRDQEFSRMVTEAKAVIVNAAAVKDDIEKYYPNRKAIIYNLPFAPIFKPEYIPFDNKVIERYRLNKQYFMISNQFWIHKDHATAFKALAILHNRGYSDYEIVCTGNQHDYRYPDYFKTLQNEIKKLGLDKKIRFLGHVPKNDQISIMNYSLAVIQPTLFEGGPGGGAVYDAVSIGKHAIVSDIPVNREIDVSCVDFFRVKDEQDLAEKMILYINKKINLCDKFDVASYNNLLVVSQQHLEMVGMRLVDAVYFVKNKN